MKRPAVWVMAMTLASGCSTRRQSTIVMLTGVGVGATGLLLFAQDDSVETGEEGGPSHDSSPMFAVLAGALCLVGGLMALGGVVGYEIASSRSTRDADADAADLAFRDRAARAVDRREQSWQLTKQAADAARAGDCKTVLLRGAEVHALDGDFYATVFARDVAIARCLDAPTAAH